MPTWAVFAYLLPEKSIFPLVLGHVLGLVPQPRQIFIQPVLIFFSDSYSIPDKIAPI
jgi:hypothetical protein